MMCCRQRGPYKCDRDFITAAVAKKVTKQDVSGRCDVSSQRCEHVARLTLEVNQSEGGVLDVSVDQAQTCTLSVQDIMAIQQAVELKFFEILASLPEEICPRAKRVKG